MSRNVMITISREYGSGGHDIGKELAGALKLPFYDNELIAMAAKETGYAESVFQDAENAHTSTFAMAIDVATAGNSYTAPLNNKLFSVQSSLIRTIADRQSAVIVGRCADYILKDYVPCINIFIQAGTEARVKTVMEREHILRTDAERRIARMDKTRATYYNFYTDRKWGDRRNYDIIINSEIGTKNAVGILMGFIRHRMPELEAQAE